MTQRWAPPTCYTLWRFTASIMKDLIVQEKLFKNPYKNATQKYVESKLIKAMHCLLAVSRSMLSAK